MGSLKRKMARKRAKRLKKDMKDQLLMFDKLPDNCLACEKEFDKKSKEHAMTWSVVVREQEGVVRLYCPDCWGMARDLVKQVQENEQSKENNST
jgi:hypothetical protein|tara:strand:- start:272 stop:553 length:282 start_codon:yes stop_codon:yes gene_type:complete